MLVLREPRRQFFEAAHFSCDVAGFFAGDDPAGGAVEETGAKDVAMKPAPGGGDAADEPCGAVTFLEHFLGDGIGGAGKLRAETFRRVVGVMKNLSREGGDAPDDFYGFVDAAAGAAGLAAVVEAEFVIGVPAGVANPFAHELRVADEAIAGGGRLGDRLDALDGLLGDAVEFFVGVEIEDPIVRGGSVGEILLRDETLPGMDDDAGAEGGGNFASLVGGAVVHDEDFVGEAEGMDGAGDAGLFVVGDDGGGDFGHWICRGANGNTPLRLFPCYVGMQGRAVFLVGA